MSEIREECVVGFCRTCNGIQSVCCEYQKTEQGWRLDVMYCQEKTVCIMQAVRSIVRLMRWRAKKMRENKILIVEDDRGLAEGIKFYLEKEGYRVVMAGSLGGGRVLYRQEKPDAVLLDLNLPDGDGMSFCREIRKNSQVPILMVTARDMETDEVMGLETGADDYLTKPFSLTVLRTRLRKLLERQQKGGVENHILKSGEIFLDESRTSVRKGAESLNLSMTEYRLLRLFLKNPNQVLLKEQILAVIWDSESNFVDENTLAVNIRRLRKKIESDPSNPMYLKTIHGMGYLWEDLKNA